MNDITEHEILYRFGWMQDNPTWRKEYELIQKLFAENVALREQVRVLKADESTYRIPGLDLR